MNVFMLRNKEGQYYCSYRKNPNRRWGTQAQGSIWPHKRIIYMILRKCHIKDADIITFELREQRPKKVKEPKKEEDQ